MLRAMRAEATARRVLWPKAIAADAAGRDSADFKKPAAPRGTGGAAGARGSALRCAAPRC